MRSRSGFTLVELLMVISILVILTVMTLYMVNVTQDEDRVRSGAAQVQSYLEGARDRAIHSQQLRGVRFILDDTGTVATSLLYIGEQNHGEELEEIPNPADPANPILARRKIIVDANDNLVFPQPDNFDPPTKELWDRLADRGLMQNTPQTGMTTPITIGRHSHHIRVIGPSGNRSYRLMREFKGLKNTPTNYRMVLNPIVLPNQEPRQFSRDVVIDLQHSKLPANWGTPGNYNQMDLLFSPTGTIAGIEASAGIINLVVAEGIDVFQGRKPGAAEKEGQERVVTVRTMTGAVSVHHVDPTDDDGTPGPDDPFRYAANGEPAR